MTDTQIISSESHAEGVTLRVHKDIDLSSSPGLRAALMELLKKKPQRVMIDLSQVGFMDSSGVATLVEALRQQRAHSGKMVLFGMNPRVKSIFEISRLDSLFTIVEDEAAAAQA